MENELVTTKEGMLTLATEYDLGSIMKPFIKEIFLLDTCIAGTMYVKDKSVFEEIRIGDELILRREPENKYDENAIRIFMIDI